MVRFSLVACFVALLLGFQLAPAAQSQSQSERLSCVSAYPEPVAWSASAEAAAFSEPRAGNLPDSPSASIPTPQNASSSIAEPQDSAASEGKQTRRILGIIPNFRSVSVDEKVPPLGAREKFKLSLEDSFDYSSFIYVGIFAGIGQAEGSYPEFHAGAPAYARYYWHNFADNLNGNLMSEFVFPAVTHEDPRYYTLGRGGFLRRTEYALSRLAITRSDSGGRSFNVAEIVGNGAGAGISNLYYPSADRTWTKTGQKWVTQIGLDGASNLIKEFWPNINAKVFHNQY